MTRELVNSVNFYCWGGDCYVARRKSSVDAMQIVCAGGEVHKVNVFTGLKMAAPAASLSEKGGCGGKKRAIQWSMTHCNDEYIEHLLTNKGLRRLFALSPIKRGAGRAEDGVNSVNYAIRKFTGAMEVHGDKGAEK